MAIARASSVDTLDACLPQTQCTQCGYPRCRAYAQALARGEADINQCPPGGETTIAALADALGVADKPLDPAFGQHRARAVAHIDEPLCIGCKLCIKACPVDAIIGAAKAMHTVLHEECTGCALCVEPCPMDCITMRPWKARQQYDDWPWPDYPRVQVERARARTDARLRRLAQPPDAGMPAASGDECSTREEIQSEIRAAVERVRARRRRPR